MTKHRRHQVILDTLKQRNIHSQHELGASLVRLGVTVSQVTLSRDLRELGISKISSGKTGRQYAPPQDASHGHPSKQDLHTLLKTFALSIEAVGQIIVIKTPPSGAQPVAFAIDQSNLPEVAGTISGDDTLAIFARSSANAKQLGARLLRSIS